MTAPSAGRVDVLAVMDRDSNHANRYRCSTEGSAHISLVECGRFARESEEAIAAVAELVAAAEAMEERIAYYAEMREFAEVNIEDWAYNDNSGDMARLRAALAQQPAAVDDAMVERAWEAAMEIKHNKEWWFPMTKRRMKRALTAALAPFQTGGAA